jgi:hypothetical protein
MSTMSETAIGLSDLLTQGNRMIAAWREALNDLEALLYIIERASGQKPARTARMEEVRPLLAEKAKAGYRPEVKALLTKYGAEKLSDITDETVLGAILTEAEELGCQSTHT